MGCLKRIELSHFAPQANALPLSYKHHVINLAYSSHNFGSGRGFTPCRRGLVPAYIQSDSTRLIKLETVCRLSWSSGHPIVQHITSGYKTGFRFRSVSFPSPYGGCTPTTLWQRNAPYPEATGSVPRIIMQMIRAILAAPNYPRQPSRQFAWYAFEAVLYFRRPP